MNRITRSALGADFVPPNRERQEREDEGRDDRNDHTEGHHRRRSEQRAAAEEDSDDHAIRRDEDPGLRVERLDPVKLFVERAPRDFKRERRSGWDGHH